MNAALWFYSQSFAGRTEERAVAFDFVPTGPMIGECITVDRWDVSAGRWAEVLLEWDGECYRKVAV